MLSESTIIKNQMSSINYHFTSKFTRFLSKCCYFKKPASNIGCQISDSMYYRDGYFRGQIESILRQFYQVMITALLFRKYRKHQSINLTVIRKNTQQAQSSQLNRAWILVCLQRMPIINRASGAKSQTHLEFAKNQGHADPH
ncbi:hypothetical protein FGO68_gene11991 [Halteria grandinella]|uniref:Uncharacterized protein n=1 Tax=Halteria grandinella TaxID=5974 RepID=A0A8J8NSN8_HALGN|nr:hypothetical protein FGO68_gene11991 [Halteria grandinella]